MLCHDQSISGRKINWTNKPIPNQISIDIGKLILEMKIGNFEIEILKMNIGHWIKCHWFDLFLIHFVK